MNAKKIETKNLELMLQSCEATRLLIEQMSPSEKTELSADWLALVESAKSADPWIHGFEMVLRQSNEIVGSCGFKGPPTPDGIVEIAYSVEPDHRGNGYATEAAQALVSYAFSQYDVSVVWAHTLPESNASTQVLTKCEFRQIREVMDPDDGLVWRWERQNEA